MNSKHTNQTTPTALAQKVLAQSVLAEFCHVGFSRDGKDILSDINFKLHAGQITTLLGPNGAGKSTIAKLLAGLEEADQGEILRHTSKIAYVPQQLTINPAMPLSVLDFVRTANRCSKDEALKALERTSAHAFANSPMLVLSGGQRQRVMLARALIRQPRLLILDEPAQGVDVNGQDQLYALIAQLRDELSCAVLLISHDLHLVMAESDHVICVQHHICCHGSPEAIQQDPAFVGMFGDKAVYEPKHIASYIHHHDHNHLPGGEVGHVHSSACRGDDENQKSKNNHQEHDVKPAGENK